MSNSILACQQLKKSFRDAADKQLDVLNGVELMIHEHETVAILGASGSGKSTLLHLLSGLDKPTEGQVLWNDQDITTYSEPQKCQMRNRHLGFVYQFHHLLPEFTALENVAMPLLIGGAEVSEAKERANKYLIKVGLGERTLHKMGELSGGERQRTAIARAIVTQPKCVLADEPTGNLDNQTANEVLKLMLSLQESLGMSFAIVTHDVNMAQRLQSCYLLELGHLSRRERL